jgi:hypothetical protein
MPNGFYGPVEQWERMEAPLQEIDSQLQTFANTRSMNIERNLTGPIAFSDGQPETYKD